MADAPRFATLVPGFDFLQGLVKNAGAAMPSIGQWVAPTLDPDELEKRIADLRTVQFWLEQNARMLGATIQALEVQRMTLSTLRTMNVQMADLRDSLTIRLPDFARSVSGTASAGPAPASVGQKEAPAAEEADREAAAAEEEAAPAVPAPKAKPAKGPAAKSEAAKGRSEKPAPGTAIDPLQWWGALTKQFTELAANALKETASDAAKSLSGATMKKPIEAAADSAVRKQRGAARRPARKRRAAAKKQAAPKP